MGKRIITVIALSLFVYWMVTVVLPVSGVELTYQYRKFLRNTFNVSDIRSLILPQFHIAQAVGTHTKDGIAIPAVFIDEPIIYNVDPNNRTSYLAALGDGIAHASSTSFPGSGGLGYYFAHSSTPDLAKQYNAVFYLLGKLNTGDKIYIWHSGDQFIYKVTKKLITLPTDLSFLHQNYPTETIVLQTCWPPGTILQRLLVFAARVYPR